MRKHVIKFAMLSTGEEILHGDIDDTNASWLAARFFDSGFTLHRRVTVGDKLTDIVDELLHCSQVSDVVIVNGGLGPTTDDVTTEAMALAMQVELTLNTTWLAEMRNYFERAGKSMPESNIKQAMLPKNAKMIPNEVGTACGFSSKLNGCLFFFTPGVPREFKHMVDKQILPELHQEFGGQNKKQLQRFITFGLSESLLNDKFSDLFLPEGCFLGYRSATPFIEVKLFANDWQDTKEISKQIVAKIGEYLVGCNQAMLNTVAELLSANKQTLSVIEGFTAGFFANWLNENQEMQTNLIQSLVLPAVTDDLKIIPDPLTSVLALSNKARLELNASIGLACQFIGAERIAVGMTTEKGNFACEVGFARKLRSREQRMYISAFMLDMVRRYLTELEVIPSVSALSIYHSVSRID